MGVLHTPLSRDFMFDKADKIHKGRFSFFPGYPFNSTPAVRHKENTL